jgi:hypothetical protein
MTTTVDRARPSLFPLPAFDRAANTDALARRAFCSLVEYPKKSYQLALARCWPSALGAAHRIQEALFGIHARSQLFLPKMKDAQVSNSAGAV